MIVCQMTENNPIYREKDVEYYSDTCAPLVKSWNSGKIELNACARGSYPGKRMAENILPGLSTIGYWNAHQIQDWGLDWHRNEGIEITFLETGSLTFGLGNEKYILVPDEFTVTRPWQPHKLGNPNISIGKLYWIILDVNVRQPHQEWQWPPWIMLTKSDIDELSKMLRQNEKPVWKANAEIRRCFQKIGQHLTNWDSERNESWISIYINELLLHMLTLFRQGPFSYNEALTESSRTMKLFIDDLPNTYYQPWTLESMAEYCGLRVTRFVHYFKLYTNNSPMHYLTYLRLEIARKRLLSHRNQNIKEIGYECGFSSSQYFSTVFRKQFGVSPAAFRLEAHDVII
jgi:AraC-like DNA-binding protein